MNKSHKIILLTALGLMIVASMVMAGSRSSAWLGVFTQEVDRDLAEAFDLPIHYGAIVNEVIEDSPAEEAGLLADDIIISFNGDRVRDDEDLFDLVDDADPDDEVTLKIYRDDKEMEISAVLDKRPRSRSYSRYGGDDDFIWTVPRAPKAPRVLKAPRAPKAPKAPRTWSYHYDHNDHSGYRSFSAEHGYLGVELVSLSRRAAQALGAERNAVLIDEVEGGSPADKGGLQAGDLIVAINGEKVADPADVQEIIWEMEEGDLARIEYVRNRSRAEVEITVEVSDEWSFGSHNIIRIPDLPDFDIDLPRMKGLHYGHSLDLDDFEFDMEEYEQEMKQLEREMRELEKELKEIKLRLD